MDKYEFIPDFEKDLIWVLCRNPELFGRIGEELDADLLNEPIHTVILRTAKLVAKDSGRGPAKPSTVVQRLRSIAEEGKATMADVRAAGFMLAEEREVDPDEVLQLVIPVLQKRARKALATSAISAYGTNAGVGEIILVAQKIESMGRVDNSIGVIMGPDSFQDIKRIQCMDKLPCGILELDVITGGGPPRGTLSFVVADYGVGKCEAAGTLLLKPDGSSVKVEDVKPGDKLLGWNSSTRRVLRVNRGHGKMVKIVPTKGEPFGVNRDHILTLWLSTHGEGEVVDVSVEDFLSWPAWKQRTAMLIRQAATFTAHKEPPILDPYILGVLLGDGCLCNANVTVCTPEPEVVNELAEECERHGLRLHTVGATGQRTAPTYGLHGLRGQANPLISALRELSLFGLSGKDKFVPARYRTGSRTERLEILAGLLDTDGHLHDHACYDYVSASRQLAEDVTFIARSVGLAAYLKPIRRGCQTGAVGDYWRVSIFGNTDMIPCRVERKKAPPRQQRKDALHVGFKIIPDGEADYYGFTLDGDGRYLHADFTVTHNSMWLCSQAAHSIYNGLFVGYLSLELDTPTVLARIKAALMGVSINSLVSDPQGFLRGERMFAKLLPQLGQLVVHQMAPFSTMIEILAWKKKAEARMGRKMDLLCIDYMDKCASHNPRDRDSDYRAMNTVYETGRLDAKTGGYWLWSASQAKNVKTGEKTQARKVGGADAADSVNKARVADYVLGASPTEDRKAYLYSIDKFRTYDCAGQSCTVEHLRSHGRMTPHLLPTMEDI